MSGAFGTHFIGAYNPHITPNNDGTSMQGGVSAPQMPITTFGAQSQSTSEETAMKIASLQSKLGRKLGPEYISQRPGPAGGPKLTYIEGWKVINLANEVFGFNGWSSSVVSLSTDFTDYFEETKRYCIGVTAIVRVTLRDGVFHEDIGYGMLENTKSKGAGLDKCKKEAVTDGLKRALRNFGNLLGNCLYDKAYASEVVKIKVEPSKLNTDELHRRPEFEKTKPRVPVDAANNYTTPSRMSMQENSSRCQNPSSLRAEIKPASNNCSTSNGTPFKLPRPPAQPMTPATTPMNLQLEKRHSFSITPAPQPKRELSESPKTLLDDTNLDSDDAFGLNDEEFLALADLAADMGRPIGEVDIEKPVEQEESTSTTTVEPKKIETLARVSEQQGSAKPANNTKKTTRISREEIIAAALQDRGESSLDSKPTSTSAAASRRPSLQPHASVAVASSSGLNSSGAAANRVQHQATAPSMAQRLYQTYVSQRIDNNPNKKGSSSGTSIPSVPSMGGGFSFSSGIHATPSSVSSTPVIGIKRPADAMSSGSELAAPVRASTMSFRGGRPGLGLHQASSAHRQVYRDGAVDIADREDVKRLKV